MPVLGTSALAAGGAGATDALWRRYDGRTAGRVGPVRHVNLNLAVEPPAAPLSPTIGVSPALVRALERQVGRRLTKTPLGPEDLLGTR